jgi:hypothetical protein
MIRKMLVVPITASLLFGCGLSWKDETPLPRQEGRSPEIISFQADEVIRPGDTWRVYLKLRDVDCDMAYVVTQIWQAGIGGYPVSFTPIKQLGCPELVGYIFLRTPFDRNLVLSQYNQYDAKIFVRDRQGNHSKSLDLPLSFDLIPSKKFPAEWQGEPAVSIGAIKIDLANAQRSETGG